MYKGQGKGGLIQDPIGKISKIMANKNAIHKNQK